MSRAPLLTSALARGLAVSEILDEDERLAICGELDDPFTWACALGRLFRAGAIPNELLPELERELAPAASFDLVQPIRIRCKQDVEQAHRILDALADASAATSEEADPWRFVEARDDLESVAHLLGALRDLAAEDGPAAEPSSRAERLLLEDLAALDERAQGIDDIMERLASDPLPAARDRILDVTTDPTAGYWVAWLAVPSLGLRWPRESIGTALAAQPSQNREARAAASDTRHPELRVGLPSGSEITLPLITGPYIDFTGSLRLHVDAADLAVLPLPALLRIFIRVGAETYGPFETQVPGSPPAGPVDVWVAVDEAYDGEERPVHPDDLLVVLVPEAA